MKDFGLDGRLGTSGEGSERKKAISEWLLARLLVHFPTSDLMVARGLREASVEGGGEGLGEQWNQGVENIWRSCERELGGWRLGGTVTHPDLGCRTSQKESPGHCGFTSTRRACGKVASIMSTNRS
jgi:hypothetical protein